MLTWELILMIFLFLAASEGAGRNVLLAALYDGLRAHRPPDVDFIKFYKRLTATLRMMRTILLNH